MTLKKQRDGRRKKEPSRMIPNGKAQECFHVVFRATKLKYVFVFMTNRSKFYAVHYEKLSACQIYDVLKKLPHSQ